MYITRLTSNEIFSPSDKTHWEVGWAKDLSAPRYNYYTASLYLNEHEEGNMTQQNMTQYDTAEYDTI
jgi:hypothetical protein